MFEPGKRVKIVDTNNRSNTEVVTLKYYGTTFFIYDDKNGLEWCCTVQGWEIIPIDEEMIAELQNDIVQANNRSIGTMAERLYNMGWRKETV